MYTYKASDLKDMGIGLIGDRKRLLKALEAYIYIYMYIYIYIHIMTIMIIMHLLIY